MPDLTPGMACALSPLVRRIVAPNPSMFTGPGTNTYLVGIDEVAIIDPGPADRAHARAIIGASMRERVRWVLLTHTHPDHWPAAARIKKTTGAEIAAFGRPPKADGDIPIDRVLHDGDVIEGTEFGLEVIHTPGHAPNHICLLLEEERVLFSGDQVLQGTTSVVIPGHGGDMQAYLASLERLRRLRRVARICPGHGDVVDEPKALLDEYVAHRKMRERQIVKTLRRGPAKIPALVADIYVDTPAMLHDLAAKQVHAHLLKLKAEGKVTGVSVKAVWKLI